MTDDELVEKMNAAFLDAFHHSSPHERMRAALAIARPIIEREALEKAATQIDHSLCDVSVDQDVFMEHRDYFAGRVRALMEKSE